MNKEKERKDVVEYLNKLPLMEFPIRIEMLIIQIIIMFISFGLGISLGNIIWR